ncbi:MAG: hypothetical protein KJ970_15110 [Candidatus Eisenbacteria bacterium]|uniref:Uncharacterized protein n=1 Tax=Eiseniibacteriota bacterium TaxID=2212470 RepID=A0A948RWP9_UNCEI|nr:hypothetical protein [Candidatus Eisenbacteria bacterium]MBU1948357.1 hypothetical protein [Candidatus Eisenbacteria bacterium]MBU2692250.1 hypothetical protein [Candidatus Eisenbacteria bacterium]
MKRVLGARAAANGLLIGLGGLAVFHALLLLGVLPASIAWGGRADDASHSFLLLELVGFTVIAFFAVIVAAKIGYLKVGRFRRVVRVGVWVVFGYFSLNVLSNLASMSGLERAIFTPVSVVLSLLAFRLAIER